MVQYGGGGGVGAGGRWYSMVVVEEWALVATSCTDGCRKRCWHLMIGAEDGRASRPRLRNFHWEGPGTQGARFRVPPYPVFSRDFAHLFFITALTPRFLFFFFTKNSRPSELRPMLLR